MVAGNWKRLRSIWAFPDIEIRCQRLDVQKNGRNLLKWRFYDVHSGNDLLVAAVQQIV